MKKILLFVGLGLFQLGVFAHQMKANAMHDGGFNWNGVSHIHTKDGRIIKTVTKVKKTVVRRKPVIQPTRDTTTYKPMAKPVRYVSNNNKAEMIKITGIKGLDGIAKVGECYTTAYVEPVCTTVAKKVLSSPAYDEIEIVPAVTKYVTKKILIEDVKIIEEYVPALYENVSKKVLVKESYTEWKKGNFSPVQKTLNGETYCLVTVPAQYKYTVEKVLKVPATTKKRTIPAVYKTVKQKVIVSPARHKVSRHISAKYKTVQSCVEDKAGHYEWRSILCEQNATSVVLKNFERALSRRGYLSSSNVDGKINEQTVLAIKEFQRKNKLKVDGLVNIDTVKALGVKY